MGGSLWYKERIKDPYSGTVFGILDILIIGISFNLRKVAASSKKLLLAQPELTVHYPRKPAGSFGIKKSDAPENVPF